MVAHLESLGHRVLTAHLASPTVHAEDGGLAAEAVFERDRAWLRDCGAVIAEVSTPSHGVGFEIAHALERPRQQDAHGHPAARVQFRGLQDPG